jgi:hypothetical protein
MSNKEKSRRAVLDLRLLGLLTYLLRTQGLDSLALYVYLLRTSVLFILQHGESIVVKWKYSVGFSMGPGIRRKKPFRARRGK